MSPRIFLAHVGVGRIIRDRRDGWGQGPPSPVMLRLMEEVDRRRRAGATHVTFVSMEAQEAIAKAYGEEMAARLFTVMT